jgi:flagellar motor protein MotB
LKAALQLSGDGLQRLNAKCLLMLSNIDEFKDTAMELYGQDKDGTYNETFTGQDIGGWTRNTVKWDDMTGQTRQEAAIQALQFFKEGQGDFPFSAVLEAGGFDDPTEIMERGHAEMQERMKMQQAMQPPGQPGQGGPPPGGPPGGAGGGAESSPAAPPGGAPVQPPPAPQDQMPNFQPVAQSPAQGGKGSPAPVPDPSDELDQAVHSVALRGQAEVVARGSGWVIEITDNADASRIRFAIKPIEQALNIKVAIVTQPADKVA